MQNPLDIWILRSPAWQRCIARWLGCDGDQVSAAHQESCSCSVEIKSQGRNGALMGNWSSFKCSSRTRYEGGAIRTVQPSFDKSRLIFNSPRGRERPPQEGESRKEVSDAKGSSLVLWKVFCVGKPWLKRATGLWLEGSNWRMDALANPDWPADPGQPPNPHFESGRTHPGAPSTASQFLAFLSQMKEYHPGFRSKTLNEKLNIDRKVVFNSLQERIR